MSETYSDLWLLIALGNPGQHYKDTRHNVGIRVLCDVLSDAESLALNAKLQARIIKRNKVVWATSEVFMNVSGESVVAVARYYKIPFSNIVVIHDELDLPLGQIRLKFSGGLAGHNGLRSVADQLGTNSFWRLRIGIGRPNGKRDIVSYVLGAMTESEYAEVAHNIPAIGNSLRLLVEGESEKAVQNLRSAQTVGVF